MGTYCGFPQLPSGHVRGALPPGMTDVEHSREIEAAGYEVEVYRADDLHDPDTLELDTEAFAAWQPDPPPGEGWTLAWKSDDEDGCNVVFWRPKAAA